MNEEQFLWPAVFRPDGQRELIRVGSKYDGGYIFSADMIARTEHILTYGLGLNWDFERDIDRLVPIKTIHCYDHTITPKKIRSNFIFGVLRFPFKTAKRIHRIRTAIDYFRFFHNNDNIRHFQMMVGTRDTASETSVNATFGRLPPKAGGILLKCDIEGGEYEILEDLLAVAPECVGLAIEFHDTGANLATIQKAVAQLRTTHFLDHFHINNDGGMDEDGIAKVTELTFSCKMLRPTEDVSIGDLLKKRRTERDGQLLDEPNEPRKAEIAPRFAPV